MYSDFQKEQIVKINSTYGITDSLEKSEKNELNQEETSNDVSKGFIGILPNGKKLHVDPFSEFHKGFDREDHLSAIRVYGSIKNESPSLAVQISKNMNAHAALADATFNKSLNYEDNGMFNFEKGGEGSKGGKVIGHTKSGKPIYDSHSHEGHKDFSSEDHKDAAEHHENESSNHFEDSKNFARNKNHQGFLNSKQAEKYHSQMVDKHKESAGKLGKSQETDLIKGGGKRAVEGEVRIWGGNKWVKHSEGWVNISKKGKVKLSLPGGKEVEGSEEHAKHFNHHTDRHEREGSKKEETKVEELNHDHKIGDTVKIPNNLTSDPNNKRGESGKIEEVEGDTIRVRFTDGTSGKYDYTALESHKEETKVEEKTTAKSDLSPVELLNKKNKELVSVEEKLDNHVSGSNTLEDSEVKSLRDKKEILQQVVKKLEAKAKVDKSDKVKEDKKAAAEASKDVKEEEMPEEEEKTKKDNTLPKIGSIYKTDSHLGGTFDVKYEGEKDGKHVFKNMNKSFGGKVMRVNTEDLEDFIISEVK